MSISGMDANALATHSAGRKKSNKNKKIKSNPMEKNRRANTTTTTTATTTPPKQKRKMEENAIIFLVAIKSEIQPTPKKLDVETRKNRKKKRINGFN